MSFAHRVSLLLAAPLLLPFIAGAQSLPLGTPVALPSLGYSAVFPTGLNNMGQIVGYGAGSNNGAFWLYWASATADPVALDSGVFPQPLPTAINDAGQISGASDPTGLLWTSPGAVPTGVSQGNPSGINNSGQMIGSDSSGNLVFWSSSHNVQLYVPPPAPGATLLRGSIYAIAAINDAGQFVACYSTGCYFWSGLGATPVLVGPGADSAALNDFGNMVFGTTYYTGVAGPSTTLPFSPTADFTAINDSGEMTSTNTSGNGVIVRYLDPGPNQSVPVDPTTNLAAVTLNGSGVTISGAAASYAWTEGSTVLGTTPSVTASFNLGVHNLVFTVTDPNGVSMSAGVQITVGVPTLTSQVGQLQNTVNTDFATLFTNTGGLASSNAALTNQLSNDSAAIQSSLTTILNDTSSLVSFNGTLAAQLAGIQTGLGTLANLGSALAAVQAGQTATNNTLAGLQTTLNTVNGNAANLVAQQSASLNVAIEDALSGRRASVPISFQLPASLGGQLDAVKLLVHTLLANAAIAGLIVGRNAASLLARADTDFSAGKYADAFSEYEQAYQQIRPH
ncbi:MAG: hypothetical protein ACRD1Y_10585 [Terriglobales bacterium]